LGKKVFWISPLEKQDNYSEYELSHKYICDKTGISKEKYSFWPNKQPQWDAIGMSEDRKVLYLVEAKAHLTELDSKMSASSELSIGKITEAMSQVFNQQYSNGNFDKWFNQYYQLGNRLTFLNKLNDLSNETGLKVKLVLLNFVDDFTYKPTSNEDWENHYKEVFKDMTGSENTPVDVIVINYSVECRGNAKNSTSASY